MAFASAATIPGQDGSLHCGFIRCTDQLSSMIRNHQHKRQLTKQGLTNTEPVRFQIREPYRHKSFHTASLCSSIVEEVFTTTSLNFPLAHSSCQLPGLPLRTFNNSTFNLGKPTPGKPSSVSLCNGWICQRQVQAVVFNVR